ncbi:ImmA/IrrE family metallo-endopeptidase [Streptococcus ruminicola]|uniref:ImmA/IrrE family metallo-endopeptidase n=1 Tax=Streptococcus ruminicola TaxID=2686210 RepID=A0AAE6UZB1_9STRE|nr:XRE family transcriptional regulator [Streptococcus ruminicola]QGZ27077.1 ImmA/IrrE family metallo-endopeptidase [Streptococcus ruminicola]
MFNGQILRELRLLNGLSRDELAKKMEMSEQSIWQFETGHAQPKLETQFRLSQIFNVNFEYFEGDSSKISFERSAIAFRNADATSKKTISVQEVYLNTLNRYVNYLENYVLMPDNFIDNLSDKVLDLVISKASISDIAYIARKELNISDDNSDLMFKIEKSGVYVIERMINGAADAYSAWSKDFKPYIVLGREKSSVRRNFDLAHELGHILLHKMVDFDSLTKEELQKCEDQANLFASCFLLPEYRFIEDFKTMVGTKVSNPDSYIRMKKQYNVSIQALEYRAYKLKLLTPAQNSYFYRLITKKNYKIIEPLDKEIPLKLPGKLKSILDVILSNELISLEQMLTELRVNSDFFCQLFSIDSEFFDKYRTNQNISDLSNIIHINSRKF